MKLQTLLDRLYAAGHWFELDEHNNTLICRESSTRAPTAAQQRAIDQYGAAIARRVELAAAAAECLVERARLRRSGSSAARDLLYELRDAGLSIATDGERLIVAPASKLSDAQRAAIRAAKPELLKLLMQTSVGDAP